MAKKRCPGGDRWPLSEREDDAVWVPCTRPVGHDGPHYFIWRWAHDRPMPRSDQDLAASKKL
jgi:hypothetical protein